MESVDAHQIPQKAVLIRIQTVKYFRPPNVKYLAVGNGLPLPQDFQESVLVIEKLNIDWLPNPQVNYNVMYTTRLISLPCGSCIEAPSLLGRDRISNGIRSMPVVFNPIRGACSTNIVIPKGFVGLINRHGRYVGLWDAGFKWAPPWVTISHLVPTQYIVYDTPVKECPTQDNVMVTIDVCLVLRILTDDEKAVYNFCYKLGPRGLDEMLKAFQEESIRGMTRKRKYNEIYDLMDSQQDKQMDAQKRELNDHFSQFGVEITDISVTNVHLPKEFADNMQETTVWHNRNQFKTLQQEYDLRVCSCE